VKLDSSSGASAGQARWDPIGSVVIPAGQAPLGGGQEPTAVQATPVNAMA
jgi:hypothetical protein